MSPIRLEKLETAIRTVLDFNEAFNRHDVPAMTQLMSDDCSYESPAPAPDGTVFKGKATITQYWQELFNRSPSAHYQIEDVFSFGERCILHGKYNGADTTGGERTIRRVDIFRVRAGLICEQLAYVKG
jgi:ketosteroid isomerase-like protein